MLFNDSKFVAYLSENFVGVASDDVAYNNLPSEAKKQAEYQFLKSSLGDGGNNIHQGVYAVTPSGRFLGKIDTGWPTYDAAGSLRNLRVAVDKYREMPKSERIGRRVMKESDRSMAKAEELAQAGVLKMRTTARHYAFPEMELFDQRHPEYAKLDAFWLSPSEQQSMLPSTHKKGERCYLADSLVERMLLHCQPMEGCGAWWKEHIQKQKLEVEVSKVKGSQVFLKFSGELAMSADSQWNKSDYSGRLLGVGVWDEKLKAFTRLEWVTLGMRELKELKSNMHRGGTKETMIASYMRLARNVKEEQGLKPHHWEHYPSSIKRR